MIITVILAVGLIGTLGYVFYQNVIQKKDNVSKTDASPKTSTQGNNKSSGTVVEDKNTFKITEWGIKGIYKGSHPVTYSIDSSGGSGNLGTPNMPTVSFTSQDLSGVCADVSQAPATFSKLTTGDKVYQAGQAMAVEEAYGSDPSMIKKIGNSYYVYHSHQQGCYQTGSETLDAVWVKISDDIKAYFDTIEAI